MAHSIAAKYAARPAARFVRPSARARERRLGLGAVSPFAAVSSRLTQLHRSEAGPFVRLRSSHGLRPTRAVVRDRRPRPQVQIFWARSGRSGAGRRPSAAAAPWHA